MGEINLKAAFDELRIIIEPSFQNEWLLHWEIPEKLPVWIWRQLGAPNH